MPASDDGDRGASGRVSSTGAPRGGEADGLRVVSLIPAATEIVHALGMGPALVARSHECDHPPGVEALPAVTEPKYTPDGTSYGIDEAVKALLQEGLSIYRVDADAMVRLHPDVIVTQDQCEVCAATLRDVEEALCCFLGETPRVVSLTPGSLADVLDDFRRVAAGLGVPRRADGLVDRLTERMARVAASASAASARPTVAVVEWLEPLMAAGNWIPELVERAGGLPLFGRAGEHSPWLEWVRLRAADPDVIVVAPCGFTRERTRSEIGLLHDLDGWEDLRAVRASRVFIADGHYYFNRPGPRLVDTLEILAELVHPELFAPRHKGSGWERMEPMAR